MDESPLAAALFHPQNMYRFISPTGEVIKTKTIAEFARKYGFRYSNARSLACGHFQTLRGFCSTHPKAKKRRGRFTTQLQDLKTGTRECIGPSIKAFAQRHNVCANDISLVLAGKKLAAKGWILQNALAQLEIADSRGEKQPQPSNTT